MNDKTSMLHNEGSIEKTKQLCRVSTISFFQLESRKKRA